MKKNQKGFVLLGVVGSSIFGVVAAVTMIKIAAVGVAVACVGHIPAWERAKATHTEPIYQAQQMWPQQVFNKIPNVEITYKNGNGGNFVGGVDSAK